MTIKGELVSKSNSRMITSLGGHIRSIKSAKALLWMDGAVKQLRIEWKNKKTIEKPVGLELQVFYSSRRPDLDIALVMDALQNAEVLKNDRQVYELYARKLLDKNDPRVELNIYTLD